MPVFTHGSRRAARSLPALALIAGLAALPGVADGASATKKLKPAATATAAGSDAADGCPTKAKSLSVGGSCDWASTLRFTLGSDEIAKGVLTLKLRSSTSGTIRIRGGAGSVDPGELLASARAKKGTLSFDVLDGLPGESGPVSLVVESTSASTGRFSSPVLQVRAGDRPDEDAGEPGTPTTPTTPTTPVTPPGPVTTPTPPVTPPATTPGTVNPAAPTNNASVWLERSAIRALPMSGTGWTRVKSAADGSLGSADVQNQDSDHDVNTLAAALVYVRTGDESYRAKVASAINGAIGTERGGRTLALGRNLPSYVVAADLIGLSGYDASLDGRFRSWIAAARTEDLDGLTLIRTHEQRPNNWGTMAGAARIAVDLYLGDSTDLARATKVFRGYLGDRSSYTGFSFGDLSYQADSSNPVGINPAGATKSGVNIDGAIPDDMRRGCSFQPVPCHTGYAWEAMQGVVLQAELLSKHGQPAYSWSGNAVLRAASYLRRLDQAYGGWWAASDDQWQPFIINAAYGTSLPAVSGGPGKNFGWTDWVYGA